MRNVDTPTPMSTFRDISVLSTGLLVTLTLLTATMRMTGLMLWNRYGAPEWKARKRAKHRMPARMGRHSYVVRPGYRPMAVPQVMVWRFKGLLTTIQHHAA